MNGNSESEKERLEREICKHLEMTIDSSMAFARSLSKYALRDDCDFVFGGTVTKQYINFIEYTSSSLQRAHQSAENMSNADFIDLKKEVEKKLEALQKSEERENNSRQSMN